MSIRDAFENLLIELNKVQAPSLLVDDFIYMFNKSIQQYINKRYNLFETKQQLTDDLRVLTNTVKVIPTVNTQNNIFGISYDCNLPIDYMHILNCICEFKGNRSDCFVEGEVIHQGANKLDTTQWAHVINNYYMKPSVKQPYYYIINVSNPTKLNNTPDSVKKQNTSQGSEVRYGNASMPIMQIKCGDDPNYKLQAVYIDYLRAPQYLSLSQELLDDPDDKSQIIEFPDYVVYEIINEIVTMVLENTQNPRLQTQVATTKTIA